MDPRYHKLAERLTTHSVALKKGETVFIEAVDIPEAFVIALIRATRARGAHPIVSIRNQRIQRELFAGATEEQFSLQNSFELHRFKEVDSYIALRGAENIFEYSDVPTSKMALALKKLKPALDWRLKKTRWVVLRWPTSSMAQQCFKSTEAFEDFFFDVCTFDYSKMLPGMRALKKLMDKTDRVHIKNPGTDLKFSIKNIPAIADAATHNVPDGEVFTAPVKDSVEGHISYNAPSVYQGVSFENVRLEFKKGKIVNATANDTKRINKIFNMDKGARFIGEFALGFNPFIKEPMRDILFDEKIAGSFHFTPGQAYQQADNGNKSQVHWDLVSIQRKDYGGGEIYFNNKLVRKDGMFIPKSLQKLNPKELLK